LEVKSEEGSLVKRYNMKTSIILSFFLLAIAGCQTLNNGKQEQANAALTIKPSLVIDKAPIVEIKVDQEIKLSKPLNIHWRISNPNDEAIYIYSSLLKNPAVANILLDTKEKTVEIQFTQLNLISVAPYSFPSTEFIKIESKKSSEGEFVGNKPIGQKDYFDSKETGVKLQQITEGKWQSRVAVAYGSEIDNVEELSEEHPINPIVRWQKIAYSEPVIISFRK
jgi:hypothetical protein